MIDKYYLEREQKEVEQDFNMSKVNKNFITLTELKERTKEATKKLYPAIANFNQKRALAKFVELLAEKFGDRLLIDGEDLISVEYTPRHDNGLYEDLKTTIFGNKYTFGCFLTFAIDGFIYYIQFGENPLFDNSSYIRTEKIVKYQDKYILREYYGTQDDTNINDLFKGLYTPNFNVELNGKKLFDYFMEKRYKKEGLRYVGKDERVYVLGDKTIIETLK